MITPERKHQLAVEIGARRANDALERTPDGIVYRIISGLDDIAPFPEAEKRQAAYDIADLIRGGHAVFVRPQDYVGNGEGEPVSTEEPQPLKRGDRVRLTQQVAHCGPGCEGTVDAYIHTLAADNSVRVNIDGFGLLMCPPAALERIEKGA